jgi:hypothetical protein
MAQSDESAAARLRCLSRLARGLAVAGALAAVAGAGLEIGPLFLGGALAAAGGLAGDNQIDTLERRGAAAERARDAFRQDP